MRGFQENKAELGAMQRLVGDAFGTGNEDDELWLRYHAMELHGGSVRDIVRSRPSQIACDQIGISGILNRGPELGGHDNKETAFQPGHEAPLGGLMKQAAGECRLQSGDPDGVGVGKRCLPRIVEGHQELGHLGAGRSQIRVILYAQWIAYRANTDA